MEYKLTQREYVNLKRRLTIVLNEKNSEKIVAECRRAFHIFDSKGFPDDWSRWQRAMDDAIFLQSTFSKKWF